jgi:uncharacterized protein (DUF2235 family)
MAAVELPSQHNRVALFLDGTWNTSYDNTNVWRLKCLCPTTPEQKVYYSVGVGTQRGEKVTGGAFGIGINEEVIQAYEWLIENYVNQDHIFIFGFSRGAFTARSLAGFISKCGLLRPGSPVSLKQMYDRYREGNATSILALQNKSDGLSLEDRWLKTYSRAVPIWFQGVWDTVGTLGMPIPLLPHVSKKDFAFLETDLRINDTHAYHALAIDEHRPAFKPTLWQKVVPPSGATPPPRDYFQVEQHWFVGAHANVGGGYENDLLAQRPLEWMMGKATEHGLKFSNAVALDTGASSCPIRDSYSEMAGGLYKAFTLGMRHFRPVGVDPWQTEGGMTNTINESIDRSVFERWREDKAYRPQNLQEWANRRKVDPGALTTSVNATTPTIVVED